ncbi:peptide/nickel transport system ATP-binding protein [Rhizobium sp. PP-F2F-G38]|uniref:dipeptide ABC transporter ATP-binding protein n=1 Tax=Rhizobium sp. PP-CC-3G-465 TaxID=2135648 RepID=UPI000D9F2060|nr:peptide/nickel transport system ATP-binding protein [Rhizobium sp. PP-WC-1G-195]PYE39550.1 peptide/nickel transport system ATP-binding protein [Rhizobium sp. PP-F2F-G20b]PYE93287.1 peptide/nickel transport system ATP-binding protein [Rhizobium sp. PP-F2F-G38]TCL89397.1 peptide/nickel transport system ATP-binding protein [Rhizobium sp. PP-WC-2G-219]TCP77785.1 peptide/nickel transport system ATP-binding protein [Rhizobium sp. PP-CC-2G-626]TCQ14507.1 peptide/nickel transport system ATP-binding
MIKDIMQKPLLELEKLTISYRSRSQTRPVLRNVDLSLRRGEILGLIGESGAGKSTVGNAIIGLLAPEFVQTSGSILFEGRALEAMDEQERDALRSRRIAAIFQDHTMSLDPLMSIGAQLTEAIRAACPDLSGKQTRGRAIELLTRVGIESPSERYHSYPHQLSGGQRQRVVIAIALSGTPDIIVADEPTSALDATIQKQILQLLRELVAETGVSIILVTHDMGVISEIADAVVVMRDGNVVEQGSTATLLDHPVEPYTRDLLAAVPRLRMSRARADPAFAVASNASADDEEPAKRAAILVVSGVTKAFGGTSFGWSRKPRKPALQDISLELEPGVITGIVGESGSGKSTIGRIIAGLETACEGEIIIDGTRVDVTRRRQPGGMLGRVQMIFQDPAMSLNPRLPIGDTLAESVRFGSAPSTDERLAISVIMDRLGLPMPFLTRYPHQLSGGQKQRVCIARALLSKPRIIVADEPTSALDVSVQAEIVELLGQAVSQDGISMLFISHDLALVQALCSSIYIFQNGSVVDGGSPEFIFSRSTNAYTRCLIDARPERFTI